MNSNIVKTINVRELKNRLEQDPALTIIDVRELYEWQNGHIPEATHIPKGELFSKITSTFPDKKKAIYLQCQGGVRSLDAAHSLIELGYEDVYSVEGGLNAWITSGFPTE